MNMIKNTSLSTALLTLSLNACANAMQGAYIIKDGWKPSEITQFNTDVGKPLAIVNLFTSFDYNWPNQLRYQTSNIVSTQATPMITWMPITSTRKTVNLLPEILAGQWDTYIDNWIIGLKAWQASYPVANKPNLLIRFAHEFNGNWYPWGNDPNHFTSAWRYIKTRFDAAGVTGVEWVWCANNVSVDSYNNVNVYYPGDDVVDWTGLDGYNWGSNYSFSHWKSFNETFSIPYINLVTSFPNKPVMLGEVASTEPSDLPNPVYGQNGNNSDVNESKEAWVGDMYSRIISDYPAIRAVAWFNINKELSWALNGTAQNGLANTGLTAYRAAMSNAFYQGTFTPLSNSLIVNFSIDESDNSIVNLFKNQEGSNINSLYLTQYTVGDISLNPALWGNENSANYLLKTATLFDNTQAARPANLPNKGLYHILPIAEGHTLQAAEAFGFRNLAKKALEAILDAKLDLIEP